MKRSSFRAWLLVLLALSAGLRIELALRGGQRYFPDENRYLRSTIVLRLLMQDRADQALDLVLSSPDHTGFILVGFIPAVAQRAWLSFVGGPPGREGQDTTLFVPACLLSLASVASIGLVAAIARRAGAGREEALGAAFLMSCAMTLFYYSRHLLPYDSAMALALGGLWLGLRERMGFARSLLVGLLCGAAFMTYNGYWMTALAVMALSVLWRVPSAWNFVSRCAGVAGGFLIWPAALTAVTQSLERPSFAREMARFSREAATQADFSEGWRFPIEFLWQAEHGLLIVFLVGAGLNLYAAARHRSSSSLRGLAFLGAAVFMYVLIGLLSTQAERIGVFGRQVRQMVPFLSLAAACGVSILWSGANRGQRLAVRVTCVCLVVQSAFHFAPPFKQRFPMEFSREAVARFGPMARETTVEVSPDGTEGTPVPSRYVLLNARYLYPARATKEAPIGAVVLQAAHPLQFRLYQYESHVPEERSLLRLSDISMRVIDTAGGSGAPGAPGS